MRNGLVVLPIVCGISLLSGCAYFKSASIEPWSVKPTMTVRHSRENPEAMYQLGRYYQGRNRYEQAIVAYNKALAADNSYADAHNGLAVVYWLQGRHAESIVEFGKAVEKAPGAVRFYNNLGYAYYLQGRYLDSVTALRKSITLEPDNKRTRDNLSQAYAKAGVMNETSVVRIQGEKVPGAALGEASVAAKDQASASVIAPAPVTHNEPKSVMQLDLGLALDTVGPNPVVPLVDNPIVAVQTADNVYELRERKRSEMLPVADTLVIEDKLATLMSRPLRKK